MEHRAASASSMDERMIRMTAQMQAIEYSLAEARNDATAKCKEVEEGQRAYAYQQDKLMHAMRQASAQAEAASAARSDALRCQEQLQLYQQEKQDLAEALTSFRADCCSIRTLISSHVHGQNDQDPDVGMTNQYNASRSPGGMRAGSIIQGAQSAMASLQRDVAGVVGQLIEKQAQGSEQMADMQTQTSLDHEWQQAADVQELQAQLEEKSAAFTAQSNQLLEAQEEANHWMLKLDQAQTEADVKQQHLEHLTTDHILEAERVGQACRDAAVMAQQIDALLAEASVRNLELAEARSDAASKAEQLHIWRQQASTETSRVSPLHPKVVILTGSISARRFVSSWITPCLHGSGTRGEPGICCKGCICWCERSAFPLLHWFSSRRSRHIMMSRPCPAGWYYRFTPSFGLPDSPCFKSSDAFIGAFPGQAPGPT